MNYKCDILIFCLLILGCEIICIKAVSFNTTDSEDKCSKKIEVDCQELNLYYCVKPDRVDHCCSEQEYFDQFPKLSDLHAEPRIHESDLKQTIGVVFGVLFLCSCQLLLLLS